MPWKDKSDEAQNRAEREPDARCLRFRRVGIHCHSGTSSPTNAWLAAYAFCKVPARGYLWGDMLRRVASELFRLQPAAFPEERGGQLPLSRDSDPRPEQVDHGGLLLIPPNRPPLMSRFSSL